jgi:protein phosphatase PTC7
MARAGAWVKTDKGVQVVPDLRPVTNAEGDGDEHSLQLVTLQSQIATDLVGAAKVASVSRTIDGPFAKEVKKYYPHEVWHGGKEDDICVVVVVVSEEEGAPAPAKAKL